MYHNTLKKKKKSNSKDTIGRFSLVNIEVASHSQNCESLIHSSMKLITVEISKNQVIVNQAVNKVRCFTEKCK